MRTPLQCPGLGDISYPVHSATKRARMLRHGRAVWAMQIPRGNSARCRSGAYGNWWMDPTGKTHPTPGAWLRATRKELGEKAKDMNERQLVWKTIQDVIGPASDWPQAMPGFLLRKKPPLNNQERLKIVTFLASNGCDPQFFLHWFQIS